MSPVLVALGVSLMLVILLIIVCGGLFDENSSLKRDLESQRSQNKQLVKANAEMLGYVEVSKKVVDDLVGTCRVNFDKLEAIVEDAKREVNDAYVKGYSRGRDVSNYNSLD